MFFPAYAICTIARVFSASALASAHAHAQHDQIVLAHDGPREDDVLAIAAKIELPIDHFNATDDRTFENRYWYNDTFYSSPSTQGHPGTPRPVIFYDAGERGLIPGSIRSNFQPERPIMQLAARYNALVVIWEHRFYGLSLAFPELQPNSSRNELEQGFKYLNTEQALEDAVVFAENFQPPGLEEHWEASKPDSTPWIWIGGSYAGQRAVMIRKRNPDVFWASWSSSAPVQVALEFPEYYSQIARDLPGGCRGVIRRVVERVDQIILHGTRMERLGLRWEIVRRWKDGQSWRERMQWVAFAPDFVVAEWFVKIIAGDWQWKGMRGGMDEICRNLTLDAGGEDRSIDADIAAVLDAIEASTDASHKVPDNFPFPMDELAWRYQTATEYPYLRTADPTSPYSILSSVLDFNTTWFYHHAQSFPWISSPPNVSAVAPAKYAGWDVELPERVLVTSGLRDPWHQLSALPNGGLVPGAPMNRTATQNVPACGKRLAKDEVFGLVLDEGFHCNDLEAGSPEAIAATELFAKALDVWLPCFKPRESARESSCSM